MHIMYVKLSNAYWTWIFLVDDKKYSDKSKKKKKKHGQPTEELLGRLTIPHEIDGKFTRTSMSKSLRVARSHRGGNQSRGRDFEGLSGGGGSEDRPHALGVAKCWELGMN